MKKKLFFVLIAFGVIITAFLTITSSCKEELPYNPCPRLSDVFVDFEITDPIATTAYQPITNDTYFTDPSLLSQAALATDECSYHGSLRFNLGAYDCNAPVDKTIYFNTNDDKSNAFGYFYGVSKIQPIIEVYFLLLLILLRKTLIWKLQEHFRSPHITTWEVQ